MIWILISVLSIVCAALYRLGGWDRGPGTWVRDWMIPLSMIVIIAIKFGLSWWLLACYLLCVAGLSTYWDFLFDFDNIWFHGFMVGLSCFPLYFVGVSPIFIGARCVVLAVLMGGLNEYFNRRPYRYSDWVEELSRGFVIIATIPLLFLH